MCTVFLPTILNANTVIYETMYIFRSVAFSCFEMILYSDCWKSEGAPRISDPILMFVKNFFKNK